MIACLVGFHAHARARLVIYPPSPPNESARRIVIALRSGKLADANRYLGDLPQHGDFDQAWREFLRSRVLFEEGHFAEASTCARRAAAVALALQESTPSATDKWPLATAALETQGQALRRQDLYHEAGRIHKLAEELRRCHGTPQEQIETALSLAACAEWQGDGPRAESFYQSSTRFEADTEDIALHLASALIRFSTWLTRCERHQEAMNKAGAASRLLQLFLPGELVSAAAGLTALQALIRYSEAIYTHEPRRTADLLKQATIDLNAMIEVFSSFGNTAAAEQDWCEQQLDFVARLLGSIAMTLPE